jgi:hypothetical protein
MKADITRDPKARLRIVPALVLAAFCLATAIAAMPFIPVHAAAAEESMSAIPAETPDPNEVLTEESAAALIDEYSGALTEILNNDEAKVNEIIGGWDAANLSGKTREQAMTMLFVDVKRVISDPTTRNRIMIKWMAGPDEETPAPGEPAPQPAPVVRSAPGGGQPAPPVGPGPGGGENLFDPVLVGARAARWTSPEVGISDEKKRITGETENRLLVNYTKQVKRWQPPMRASYKGQAWTKIKDLDDPNVAVKEAGIDRGIKILIDKGVRLPDNLVIYLHNGQDLGCQGCERPVTIAFKRGINWAPVAAIIITSVAPEPNNPNLPYPARMSSTGFGGLDKTTITIIHEIGHILHERQAGEFFWTITRDLPPGTGWQEVSQYAGGASREFVAEVFAGAVIGKQFSPTVWAAYRQFRGPGVPGALGSFRQQW